MTDEEMGRPPRHARPKKQSEPTRVVAAVAEPEGVMCECACGRPVEVPLPETLPAFARSMAQLQLDGKVPVTCDECIEREDHEEKDREREERRAVAVASRREAAGMPPKWGRQRFGELDGAGDRGRAVELARSWGAGDFDGLLLYGPVGRGKTAIAAAAANMLVEQRPLRWLPVAELLMDLSMPFGAPERERAMKRLDAGRGRAALVLDDLDKLKPTEHAVQPLYVAINGWIEAELPLLVTLNRPLGQLRAWLPETFGDAIASRLAGYCQQREVGGVDRRLEPVAPALRVA